MEVEVHDVDEVEIIEGPVTLIEEEGKEDREVELDLAHSDVIVWFYSSFIKYLVALGVKDQVLTRYSFRTNFY